MLVCQFLYAAGLCKIKNGETLEVGIQCKNYRRSHNTQVRNPVYLVYGGEEEESDGEDEDGAAPTPTGKRKRKG